MGWFGWFIIGIIFLVVAVGLGVWAFVAKKAGEDGWVRGITYGVVGSVILALMFSLFSVIYKQDEGEAIVVKSVSGEIQSADVTPGWGGKAPWDKVVSYSTRNDSVDLDMPFNDKDGARGTLSMSVIYNISADEEGVKKLYRSFRSEAEMKSRLIEQTTRSVVNSVPNKYSTTQIKTQRGQLEADIQAELSKRFADWGFSSVQVNIKDDGYPQEITDRYNALVAERTRAEEAKAATTTAEEKAKQKVVEAKADAEARNIIANSLKSEEAMRSKELDTLAKLGEGGNLIITDGNSGTLLNVDAPKAKADK